jgi:hypothetical protein
MASVPDASEDFFLLQHFHAFNAYLAWSIKYDFSLLFFFYSAPHHQTAEYFP